MRKKEMGKSLVVLILATMGLYSCGQRIKSTTEKVAFDETVDSTKNDNSKISLPHNSDQNVYTDTLYSFSSGKGVTIQNSFPKGGIAINGNSGYTDYFTGKHYGFGIFWTRVINETTTPLELAINFPADSFAISQAPSSYFKLFLPPDTMTLHKRSLYNYGYDVTDIRSFLDANFNKSTVLHRTINPKEECLFYVIMLIHFPDQSGSIRTGLFLKEQDLFYRFRVNPLDSEIIPCGQVVLKKSKQ